MSREIPNQCRDVEDESRRRGVAPKAAWDLSDRQLWLATEIALSRDRNPEDFVRTLFLFEPTDEDRTIIRMRVKALWEGWRPWIELIKPGAKPAD